MTGNFEWKWTKYIPICIELLRDHLDQETVVKICLMLKPAAYSHIRQAKTAKEARNNLQKPYEDKGLSRRLTLMRGFVIMKLENFPTMEALSMLSCLELTLTPEYDPMVMAIESLGGTRDTKVLGLVQTDLCEPKPLRSWNGARFLHILYLKFFKGFQALLEKDREINKKVGNDNGTEYINAAFAEYLQSEEMEHYERSKGYRLFNIEKPGNIIVSRGVVFLQNRLCQNREVQAPEEPAVLIPEESKQENHILYHVSKISINPVTVIESMQSPEHDRWKEVEDVSEYTAFVENNVWTLVDCLEFLSETEITGTFLIFDESATNLSMACSLGANPDSSTDLKTCLMHFIISQIISLYLDACRMLKLIRNCLASQGRLTDHEGSEIQWKYFLSNTPILKQLEAPAIAYLVKGSDSGNAIATTSSEYLQITKKVENHDYIDATQFDAMQVPMN
ncbi:hypothetical protein ILUMI_06765 [Ignelater luminosus]|uniref:Uncharacterized protein n=1 Tax=Ignelater luminosus TaxID=2038154 RepID=A0A8K0D547_IGNLU|nr:hypothetical protein ILUMI_06765 [Ignelater luminosus]